jgi:hypothetical protein
MKFTLNELAQMVKELPYQDNRKLVCESIIDAATKKSKTFTSRKANNFRRKCLR